MSTLLSVLAVVVTAIVFVWAARVVCAFVSAGLAEPQPHSSSDDEPPEDTEIDNRSPGARLDAHLHELRASSSVEERRQALNSIANIGGPVLDPLMERLHPNDHLCIPACVVIDSVGLPILEYLLSITRDHEEDRLKRAGAAVGLWRLAKERGSAEAFAELRRLELDDPDEHVAYWAGEGLDQISRESLRQGHTLESESGGEGRAPTTDG